MPMGSEPPSLMNKGRDLAEHAQNGFETGWCGKADSFQAVCLGVSLGFVGVTKFGTHGYIAANRLGNGI